MRPVRHHGVAGFRLRLQHVSRIGADLRRHRAEAEDNIRRLRNHPSLVLWCGNNEIDVAWKPHDKRNSRFRKFYTEEEAEQFDRVNETIFRNILPGVVDSLCGGTVPYWHSSPSPGWGSIRQTAGATATYTTGTSGTKATPYRPTTPKSPVSSRNTDSNPTPNSPRSSVSSPKSAASPLRP
ncbi:MAG: hypothetical protein ACLRM8_03080 [Alistipes sp.]